MQAAAVKQANSRVVSFEQDLLAKLRSAAERARQLELLKKDPAGHVAVLLALSKAESAEIAKHPARVEAAAATLRTLLEVDDAKAPHVAALARSLAILGILVLGLVDLGPATPSEQASSPDCQRAVNEYTQYLSAWTSEMANLAQCRAQNPSPSPVPGPEEVVDLLSGQSSTTSDPCKAIVGIINQLVLLLNERLILISIYC